MVFGKDKIIGTVVPLFSLWSSQQKQQDYGTIDAGLYFLDWLHKTGQHAWQMLPLNETQLEKGSSITHVPSPYKGYGIGLDPKSLPSGYKEINPTDDQLRAFLEKHDFWIQDYALFCALRDTFETDDWRKWDNDIKIYEEKAIQNWRKKLHKQIVFYITQQWQVHQAYATLHQKAKKLHITLVGDIPFYLSLNSPLVWKYKSLFEIDNNGAMNYVSGAATKKFSHFGRQVWGHPLYTWRDWEASIAFWKMRIKYASFLYDIIRFDYAGGFFEYAAKDIHAPQNDEERHGPGEAFIDELVTYAHEKKIKVFAEDSGKHVHSLREYMTSRDIPGIRIFRYAYDELRDAINPYYADTAAYPAHAVVYSTTHDTETLVSYVQLLSEQQRKKLMAYLHITHVPTIHDVAKVLREKVIHSSANTIIIPIQDWLLSAKRINYPGTEKEIGDTNWQYRIEQPIELLPIIR